jgi:hypothetical protein
MRLQGSKVCKKKHHHPLNIEIEENSKNLQNPGIFDDFFSILTFFVVYSIYPAGTATAVQPAYPT